MSVDSGNSFILYLHCYYYLAQTLRRQNSALGRHKQTKRYLFRLWWNIVRVIREGAITDNVKRRKKCRKWVPLTPLQPYTIYSSLHRLGISLLSISAPHELNYELNIVIPCWIEKEGNKTRHIISCLLILSASPLWNYETLPSLLCWYSNLRHK